MSITVKIPASLRKFCGGQDRVAVEGKDVRQALADLERQHAGILPKLCDEAGNVRRFINIYVDSDDIRFLQSLDTELSEGAELQIIPAIAGG
jgi:molybdopterin synthase sulfur carrier subunit